MYSNHKTKIESTDILKTDMRESEMRRGTHGSPPPSLPPLLPQLSLVHTFQKRELGVWIGS